MVPASHLRFDEKQSPSLHTSIIEAVANNFLHTIEYNNHLHNNHLMVSSKGTSQVKTGTKDAVIKPVPIDLLEGVLRCRASIIDGIQNDVFQEFVHKFGLVGKSADIEPYVHKGRPGYKQFLAFCNSRFKADQLLGVGAFDDLERLSTDYHTFMMTFHDIWTCRIEPTVKVANMTDLIEATAHEGPIHVNDTEMAVLKALHNMYWGEHGPVDLR